MPAQPLVTAVASYSSRSAASRDLDAVRQARAARELPDVAMAMLEKGADGQLTIEAHDDPAEHLPRGGALLGGLLLVIATPVGIRFLVPMMRTQTDWTRVSVIAGYFWHDIPRAQLRRMSDLLEAGQAALVVVAAGPDGASIRACLAHAGDTLVTDGIWADLDA